ncbi:WG repeat-containing protein [Algoriphagus litoralis]|uniref:WG repeat-containing protein n=1 Tax=Algoriphagus litoralis TaxID=2202829 RepID=UPI000DB97F40|nr:WG repeat-containing protein [Algoriphagus litoralis]
MKTLFPLVLLLLLPFLTKGQKPIDPSDFSNDFQKSKTIVLYKGKPIQTLPAKELHLDFVRNEYLVMSNGDGFYATVDTAGNYFLLEPKKNSSSLYHNGNLVKELDRYSYSLVGVHQDYAMIFNSGHESYWYIDSKGNSLTEEPFETSTLISNPEKPYHFLWLKSFCYLVDSDLQPVPGSRYASAQRSYYNNEVNLNKVWELYGKSSPMEVYEVTQTSPDGTILHGLLDLATNTEIAEPVFTRVNPFGFLEKGIILGTTEDKLEALYDFTGAQLSDRYDGIFSNEGRLRIERNKLIGLMDYKGKVIVAPKYTAIQGSNDGSFFVCVDANQKTGIIDSSGKVILPFEFATVNYQITSYPLHRYIPVSDGKLYGYYDTKEQAMEEEFVLEMAGPVQNDMATIRTVSGEDQFIAWGARKEERVNAFESRIAQTGKAVKEIFDVVNQSFRSSVENLTTKEAFLESFYPDYREYSLNGFYKINQLLDFDLKEYSFVMTYEQRELLEQVKRDNLQLKKLIDGKIREAGGEVIGYTGYNE